jgi:hypothetical protein
MGTGLRPKERQQQDGSQFLQKKEDIPEFFKSPLRFSVY